MRWFYFKGISLIAVSGCAGYLYPGDQERFDSIRNCEYMLALMKDGKLEPKRLVTHRFGYTEMATAYDMPIQRDKSMLGVIFQWKD